jgi:hypothetical protein
MRIQHSLANKILLKNWLEENMDTRLNKAKIRILAEQTQLTECQVYDFLNHQKYRSKKIKKLDINQIN